MAGSVLLVLSLWAQVLVGPAHALQPPPSPARIVRPAEPPAIEAEAWIVYDDTLGLELASHNPTQRRSMASTTKIMTSLVVLEHAAVSELVTVSRNAAGTGQKEVGLVAGERWTVADLLTATLVGSANDAATALAEHVGGTEAGFVEMMNETAVRLGLTDTHFANPHGLDEPGHFASAADLLTLSRAAMRHPDFARLARTQVAEFPPGSDGAPRVLAATNELLGSYPGAIGIKTGFTRSAGRVLVAVAERSDRRVYAVVMGAEDADDDAAELLEYGFSTFGVGDWYFAPLARTPKTMAGLVGRFAPETVARLLAITRNWSSLMAGFGGAGRP